MNEGSTQASRSVAQPTFITNADPGYSGGGGVMVPETHATLEQYENIFGPAAREIKFDNQRNKRHQRWHLPDVLKGSNMYLTDRVDGLITDATSSPFTRNILPYVYLENPDQKLKWNVYSFDEGMASRVPYEAAARVLPQTKRSFAGYVVRQGLAIAMEHNFMVSEAGRLNFKRQLLQLVGSIQLTNDLDVHVALITAPSYQKHMDEKYMDSNRPFVQVAREHSETFGMMQKTANALDFIIEDAKTHLKTWGSQPPTFLLCNGALTTQLTMIPEKTEYITNGPNGAKRLAQGPDLPSYRGLNIINSRKFSMEAGTAPRDLLRRRVRVGQHYYIPWSQNNPFCEWEFYDQDKDSFFCLKWIDLFKHTLARNLAGHANTINETKVYYYAVNDTLTELTLPALRQEILTRLLGIEAVTDIDTALNPHTLQWPDGHPADALPHQSYNHLYVAADILVMRPCIEHEMLGIIIGRGGTQELGATFWGQTELSCYDDAQHGVWGMSYKYHERAIVTNERNLIRLYDISFDGYNGGMDDTVLNWFDEEAVNRFAESISDVSKPYNGDSMLCMLVACRNQSQVPNPLVWGPVDTAPDHGEPVCRDFGKHTVGADNSLRAAFDFYYQAVASGIGAAFSTYRNRASAGTKAVSAETDIFTTSYHGYMKTYMTPPGSYSRNPTAKISGTGHLGPCFEGVASIRMGKGQQIPRGPVSLNHLV